VVAKAAKEAKIAREAAGELEPKDAAPAAVEVKPDAKPAAECAATREAGEKLEEGEITASVKKLTKKEIENADIIADAKRQERMTIARRRMLGNIRFIGELFKKQMLTGLAWRILLSTSKGAIRPRDEISSSLDDIASRIHDDAASNIRHALLTEKIMHMCVMKMLGETTNPDEEDVEALCKLLTTIGGQLDHARAKAHMVGWCRLNRIPTHGSY